LFRLFFPGCSCLIRLSTNLNAPAIANKVLCPLTAPGTLGTEVIFITLV